MQQLYLPLKFGRQLITRIADPAAASNFTYQASNSFVEELLFLRLLLTTDANVANRQIRILISDATGEVLRFSTEETTSASLAEIWTFSPNPGLFTSSGSVYAFLPPNIIIPRGGTVVSVVQNMQAADQISDIVIQTRVWARP